MRMKRQFRTLCGLVLVSVALSSCLGDDDDNQVTTYSDVAITQFTLGSLNRYTTGKSTTTGNDTTVQTVVTGSNYKMTIDQLGHRIFNQQELPVGTDVKHVVCTIATKNGGAVALKSMTSDEMRWFNASDSIDFSEPRTFRVYSIDATATRDYTVSVTASQTTGIAFRWSLVGEGLGDGQLGQQHLVALNDSVRLVDNGIVMKNGTAYRLVDNTLECSADLTAWTVAGDASTITRLLGAGTKELFAMGTDHRLKHSLDDGATWLDEQLDDEADLLPEAGMALTAWDFTPVDSTDYVLLVGNSPAYSDSVATVWRKLSQYGGKTAGGRWVIMPADDTNHFLLPLLSNPSAAYYNGSVLVADDQGKLYESRDQGITWRSGGTYALPDALQTGRLTMAADSQGRLWVVSESGQLWCGMNK